MIGTKTTGVAHVSVHTHHCCHVCSAYLVLSQSITELAIHSMVLHMVEQYDPGEAPMKREELVALARLEMEGVPDIS